ncbi:MAG: acetate--CoA ligase family protein [Longimicrobiales bacterium]|nr:acetate--CoA ligase family protein [Longimicrobiales bacterium]
MSQSLLHRIFDPESMAVVGASSDPAKRGHQILVALAESGYSGTVHPVNPKGGEILGHPVLASVEDLPDGVDLAVLCTPAAAAPELVRSCGRRGVAGAVVLAVGFGETGEEGRALEAELERAAGESGVRLIGPNTSGLLNLRKRVNLVGVRGVRPGGLAILAQSGNMALALMTEVSDRSWDGISIYLGVGNEVDLGFAEALDYLGGHEDTHAVLVYVEGFRDAGKFLSVANRVSAAKPVVLLKSGRTAGGAEAALSHTGAVAGPYHRLSAGLAQAGVVELRRSDELLHVAETLGRQPAPSAGERIAILSDGGGQGTLAVDRLEESGCALAELSDATRDGLRELLGPAAAVSNPVDLAGAADADPEVFGRAMELLVADRSVGTVLLLGLFGGYGIRFAESLTRAERAAGDAMAEAARSAGCGLVVHTMYASHRSPGLEALGRQGVPVVGSLEVACRCVVALQRRGRWLERKPWRYEPPDPGGNRSASVRLDGPADGRTRDADGDALTEVEARGILAEAGMAFGPALVADSQEAVVEALRVLEAPVAVKLLSASISHKSDAGGVVLGVSSEGEARRAYRRVREGARVYAERHGLELTEPRRVLVTPMAEPPRAELLLGAYRDARIGAVLNLGAGGVWVEELADVTVRVLPVADGDLVEMLEELRVFRTMGRGRGRGAVALPPIFAAARAMASVLRSRPAVLEVEVNPLFVYDDRVEAIDARIVKASPSD